MEWKESIEDICKHLANGRVILYPTDTIWGLGSDSHHEEATHKIYEIKNRAIQSPLILLVNSMEMLKDYIQEIHPRVETLLSLHHKPLTIIYKASPLVPKFLLPAEGTIAIRLIYDPFLVKLIDGLGRPITSTSANVSGNPFPKNFKEIDPTIIEKVDYVVTYRQNDKSIGEPSVIARFNKKGILKFLRE